MPSPRPSNRFDQAVALVDAQGAAAAAELAAAALALKADAESHGMPVNLADLIENLAEEALAIATDGAPR